MAKTVEQWIEEAEEFVLEWDRATGKKPTLEEVKAEIATIEDAEEIAKAQGFDTTDDYAEELFGYMN